MKQHFYSRVPSRIAMFYKSNGFDTFACSTGIQQEFVEKDLAILLEQRLSPEEMALLRNNELNPVYCHFATKDKVFVESCISFLNSDYTGERSSYLINSLVFNEKEEKLAHYNDKYQTLNKDLFIQKLDSFDITSPQARPIRDYPELAWKNKNVEESIKWLQENFEQMTFKKFIFSFVLALCGKYKSVYVVLPKNDNPDYTLKFFNSVIQILPYHMRKFVSFVSRVNDFNKYPGFKLKIISDALGAAPLNKGVTINLVSNMVFGIKDSDYKIAGNVPDFLYRLITHDEERYAFFDFVDRIMENDPEIKELDIKVLIDFVFLFRASSSLYEEKNVLPNDDSMLQYLSIYEKYCEGLTDEYRMNGMMAFRRYPRDYMIIPRTVFNKLIKIYPTEIPGTKHIIMNVCLDLIHTDLMRPLLFNFIKSCYDTEDKDTQESIMKNLANVLYGGFLFAPIIELFKKCFDEQTQEIRDIILEKLFLTIRTPEIQVPLFEFVSEKYDSFNHKEKVLFYSVVAEHLPEGDELARQLLRLCDDHIIKEDDELRDSYAKGLCNVLLSENKQGTRLLLPVVSESSGFTFYEITKVVFTAWRKRKIATEFIALSCKGTLTERVDKIVKMWELAQNDIEDSLMKKFINSVIEGFDQNPCQSDIEEIFSSQVKLVMGLQMVNNPLSDSFVSTFNQEVINKLLKGALLNVFKSQNPDSVERVVRYASQNPAVMDTPNYQALPLYLDIKNAINNLDYPKLFKSLVEICKYNELTKRIANYSTIDIYNALPHETDEELLTEKVVLALITFNKLRYNHLRFSSVYDSIFEQIDKNHQEEENNKLVIQASTCRLVKVLFEVAIKIESIASIDDLIKEDVRQNDTGVANCGKEIFKKYGKAQLKVILQSSGANDDFSKFINASTKNLKSSASLFAKVLKV
ncbi:MAG: hypothetical protein J5666_00795 [Bacilli bacterium]|nr:hypothetical protein [Bacilli bacterium]